MQRSPDYWQQACRTLSKRDKVMALLIRRFKGGLSGRGNAFETLCRAIVGQQISVKAADSVWQNLERKLVKVAPQTVAERRRDVLGRCGLSASKVNYLKNLAEFFLEEPVNRHYWRQDAVVIRDRLISVKGIGNWTYEMFAIFYLQHPDIFPINDLGLLNAISRLYNNGTSLTADELNELGALWSPWRTVATWYLWRSIDPDPIIY